MDSCTYHLNLRSVFQVAVRCHFLKNFRGKDKTMQFFRKIIFMTSLLAIPSYGLAAPPKKSCNEYTQHAQVSYETTADSNADVGDIFRANKEKIDQIAKQHKLINFKITHQNLDIVKDSNENSSRILTNYALEFKPDYRAITLLSRESGASHLSFSLIHNSDCSPQK